MRVLTNIVTGDLVLPEGGKGAGKRDNQSEDDQCSPAHSFGYLNVETERQGGVPGKPARRGR